MWPQEELAGETSSSRGKPGHDLNEVGRPTREFKPRVWPRLGQTLYTNVSFLTASLDELR